jgi:predicted Zn-dependent protease
MLERPSTVDIAACESLRESLDRHLPEADEQYQDTSVRLASLYSERGLLAEASAVLDECAAKSSATPASVRLRLAEACLERGEAEHARDALRILQTCLRSDPHDRAALRMVARAFELLGQPERALIVRAEIEAIARDVGPELVVVAASTAATAPSAPADRTEKHAPVHVVEVSPGSWSAIAALQTEGPADDRVVAFVCVDGEGRNTARTIYGVVKSFFS